MGQIIEAVSGQSYQSFVREAVFRPLELYRPLLGRSPLSHRLPDEDKYHTRYQGKTVFDDSGTLVPWP